ncbi:DUF2142 domain-containing protein [Olsenella uli]|nr:DUF2142 domain-containing protein [Olsenella uli]
MYFQAKHFASGISLVSSVIRVASVVYWIFAIILMICASLFYSLDNLFFLLIYQVLFYLFFIESIGSLTRYSLNGTLQHPIVQVVVLIVFLSFVAAILLEGATVVGTPGSDVFSLQCWSKKRLIVFFLIGYILTTGVFLLYGRCKDNRQSTCRPTLRNLSRHLQPLALIILIALSISYVICLKYNLRLFPIFGLLSAALASVYVIFLFHKSHSIALETLFALIAVLFGSYLCLALPITTGISWDDQIHFKNATEISYIFDGKLTPTEVYFSELAPRRAVGEDVLSLSDWTGQTTELYSQELDSRYESDLTAGIVAYEGSDNFILTRTAIGYLPMAAGLWLGRLLHVPFSLLVIMGRFGNLFFYIILFYLSIKIAPTKKLVFLVIGLLPVNIFLASNYAYDPWIIALTACGTALLMRETWGESTSLNSKVVALSLTLISVGIMIKAVYCPILGLFFLMPKQKFVSRKQRYLYFIIIIFLGLFLLSTFAAPFLSTGGQGATDSRGGSDVSSSGQLAFILSNPVQYLGILCGYLFGEFLNPLRMNFVFNFGYLGHLGNEIASRAEPSLTNLIPIIYILIPGLLEGNSASKSSASTPSTLWTLFVSLLTSALVASSMYIVFTPVGAETVNGCQGRYLIPLLAPFVSFACNNKTISGKFQRSRHKWEIVFPIMSMGMLVVCIVCFVTLRYVKVGF